MQSVTASDYTADVLKKENTFHNTDVQLCTCADEETKKIKTRLTVYLVFLFLCLLLLIRPS